MLSLTPSEDDHAGPLGERPHGEVIDLLDVLNNVTPQWMRVLLLVRVEVEHVPDRAIRQRRREDGDLILSSPVIYRIWVVYPLSKACNHLEVK